MSKSSLRAEYFWHAAAQERFPDDLAIGLETAWHPVQNGELEEMASRWVNQMRIWFTSLTDAWQGVTYQHVQHTLASNVGAQEDHCRGPGLNGANDGCLAT